MPFQEVFGGQNIYPSQLTLLRLTLTEDVELQWPVEQAVAGAYVFADIMTLIASGTDRVVGMPNATNASPGQATLVNNVGVNDIIVQDFEGNEIGVVASGECWQFYLNQNSDPAGEWITFEFGAGTSSAVAAALAGAGLKAIVNTLNVKITPETVNSSPYTVLESDRAKAKLWIGGIGQFDLPAPATFGADWFTYIRNSGTGDLSIITPSGYINETGEDTVILSAGESMILVCAGTYWFTLNGGSIGEAFFDYISINVGGSSDYTLSGNELNRISYRLTGTLTGNINVIVPATIQQYWIDNRTNGAFTLTVKTDAGTGILVPQGEARILYSDGNNVVNAVTFDSPLSAADGGTGHSIYSIGDILYAIAPTTLERLPFNAGVTRYLANTGTGGTLPQWDLVNLATGVGGLLPYANLASLSGLSVLGRSTNSAGVMAAISGTTSQVLRVADDGVTLAFGPINISTSAAVAGTLQVVSGGLNLTTVAQGDLLYGSASNVYSLLPKSTAVLAMLSNAGSSNAPSWIIPRFSSSAPANSNITFGLADAWSWVPHTGGATQNWTVPDNGTVAFPVGTMIGVDNRAAAGTITILQGGGVTIDGQGTAGSMIIRPGYKAILVKQATDTWLCMTDSPRTSPLVTTTYAGYVAASAGSAQLPAGWSASNPGTGVTRITHNLGLASQFDLSVVPSYLSGADDRSISISATNVNFFEYTVNDIGSGPVDVATMFLAMRNL